jgi:hypothetical protein
VSSILSLFECGSVHIQRASTKRTLFRPLIRFKHKPSSSFDSSAAAIQWLGGLRKRPHVLHHVTMPSFGMSSAMSTRSAMHGVQRFWGFHMIGTPHWQHSVVGAVPLLYGRDMWYTLKDGHGLG